MYLVEGEFNAKHTDEYDDDISHVEICFNIHKMFATKIKFCMCLFYSIRKGFIVFKSLSMTLKI